MSHDSGAIRRRIERSYLVLRPPAELDAATADAFAERLVAIDANEDVVIDLQAVEFCDARGLNVLVCAQRAAEAIGSRLILSNPSPMFQRLIDICHLEDLFVIRRPNAPARSRRRLSGTDSGRR